MENNDCVPKLLKRGFDLCAATVGLVVLSPILGLVAILIRSIDGKPVFFRQNRAGLQGKLFRIYKFRTMRVNAEQNVLLATTNDVRVTRLGLVLRKFKIDEFPQLWNVVRGDMSLVGPRPEIPHYVALYTLTQREILRYRPGIVDPATFAFRNENDILDPDNIEQDYLSRILPLKLEMSLNYARRATFFSDCICILKTVVNVFRGK
jgi:lipopolysaccharide/colanic/teichoic acid biosynthesis glycosyltransferase